MNVFEIDSAFRVKNFGFYDGTAIAACGWGQWADTSYHILVWTPKWEKRFTIEQYPALRLASSHVTRTELNIHFSNKFGLCITDGRRVLDMNKPRVIYDYGVQPQNGDYPGWREYADARNDYHRAVLGGDEAIMQDGFRRWDSSDTHAVMTGVSVEGVGGLVFGPTTAKAVSGKAKNHVVQWHRGGTPRLMKLKHHPVHVSIDPGGQTFWAVCGRAIYHIDLDQ